MIISSLIALICFISVVFTSSNITADQGDGGMNEIALLIAATLSAGTVLAIAALGLLINERAGVVNLGA
jgi:hypothetical protein